MAGAVPVIRATVTLLPDVKRFGVSKGYRPHIVLGPTTQRHAILEGNTCVELYVGVAFVGGPEELRPGETAEVELAFMYHPHPMYDAVRTGATFTVREGPLVVGYGTVLSDPAP